MRVSGWTGLVLALGLAGCAVPQPQLGRTPQPPTRITEPAPLGTMQSFADIVARVEPVAEALCRARTRGIPCDLQIVVDDRPGIPANAFQTRDDRGRPIVGFTVPLLQDALNADEIAFVMGHEAAHHIAGHMARQQQLAMNGALVAGVLAAMSGADDAGVARAQSLGANAAARRYSKDFELEADALGAQIAWMAGYDPVLGAQFFARLPDPGDKFLGTHPPNLLRIELVRQRLAQLEAGR